MKIFPKQNIAFQKKLIANCAVKGSSGSIPCSIYRIEDVDRDYFIHLTSKPGWKNYLYATIIDGDIRRGNADKIYVLEDEKEDCLGFMETFTKGKSQNQLEFIEVKPTYRATKCKRTKKYIGETMLNFLAQLTKNSGKETLSVPHPDPSAMDFYNKCAFTLKKDDRAYFELSGNGMKNLEEKNLLHTGCIINFVG